MDFRTLSLNAAVATAVVAGSAIAISPAEAATITAPSSLLFGPGSVSTSIADLGGGTLQLNFTGLAPASGGGGLAGVTGTPIFQPLTLSPNGPGSYSVASVSNFVSGLTFGGDPLSVDLSGFTFSGSFVNTTNYLLGSAIFDLQFLSNGVPQVSGQGALFASSVPNTSFGVFAGTQTAIPTPALLPGLVGLGWAALRRRKAEVSEEVN